jgi:tRNA1Val (adenine37-N6)-methyltransferase
MPTSGDETVDAIFGGALRVTQPRLGYRFSLDAPLLAHFMSPGKGRAVDLGTGSGVVALALALRSPALRVDAVELQPELAALAHRNASDNQLQERVQVHHADLRTLTLASGAYDLVVSNPPYQPLEQGRVSPGSQKAIARHEIACTLDDVVSVAHRLLRPGGHLGVVYPAPRLQRLLATLDRLGFTARRLRCVHPRLGEDAQLVLVDAERGGRGLLEVMPHLVLHGTERAYLPEAAQILGERG